MDLLIVVFATLGVLLLCAILWLEFNRQHIAKNWVQYRCRPYVMPFAGLFGRDPVQNFQYCLAHSTNSYVGYLFEPIYYMFSVVTNIIGDIVKSIDDIRSMLKSVRGGFLGIVGTVIGKLENTISEIVILVVRMRDIMERLVGTMTVLAGVGLTTAATGESLMAGPIGQVIDYFCFDPMTPIELFDGTTKPIQDIRLHDVLRNNQQVTSLLRFNGQSTKMFNLDGVIVSGNHIVQDGEQWIYVRDHPLAQPAASLPVLYCLNTSDHLIPVKNLLFRDFEEISHESLVADIQEFIADELQQSRFNMVSGTYETGLAPDTLIATKTGVKPIAELELNEQLKYGSRVTGIMVHDASDSDWVVSNGTVCLADTVFMEPRTRQAARARLIPYRRAAIKPPVACHLTTTTGRIALANGSIILDEQESYDAYTNAKRDHLVMSHLNRA